MEATMHGIISVPWRYDAKELLADGVVHVVGVALAVLGAFGLAAVAPQASLDSAAIAIYAGALLATLGLSAAYNMWPVSPTKWLLRRLDHASIYFLIAGTYTPFVVLTKFGTAATSLLLGIWSVALLGTGLKLLLPGRYDGLSIALYLALGWSGLATYDSVIAFLPTAAIWLVVAGGALYSAGVVFHLWAGLRFQNAIWHGFVLVAASCHYAAVFACAVGTS
jgi:hemolysin III